MSNRQREEFLLKVRQSLGRRGPMRPLDRTSLVRGAPSEGVKGIRSKLETLAAEQRTVLLDKLEEELSAVRAQVARASSKQEVESYLKELVADKKLEKVVRWDSPLLSRLDSALQQAGAEVAFTRRAGEDHRSRERVRQVIIDSDLGLTEADFAIADTGTLVLLSGEAQSRLVSLAPPVHVALVKPAVVVPSMKDLLPLFSAMRREKGRDFANNVTFVTGPSRTADIEKVLTIGVHGPEELHVVILDYL